MSTGVRARLLPRSCAASSGSPALADAARVRPPGQPLSGPGGARLAHGGVRRTGPFGSGPRAYYIYEPCDPTPASAPVVVFLHGHLGVDPQYYGAWIDHLTRRGQIVVFPVYQTSLLRVWAYSRDAVAAVAAAMRRLVGGSGHVRPSPDGRWAVVGHSLGGPLAVNLALGAADAGLAPPSALMLITPGDGGLGLTGPPADLADLLLLVVVADHDGIAGERLGRRIFHGATGLGAAQRNLVRLRRDGNLRAGHFGPIVIDRSYASSPEFLARFRAPARAMLPACAGAADAHTWYGYWKWCDGLLGAALAGREADLAYALGDTPQQRFMGLWSDGRPVREAEVEIPG